MISQTQFGSQSMTASKQAMPESPKYDGPAALEISGIQNKFVPNFNKPLPKPGVGA